jgi:hypothetical protein
MSHLVPSFRHQPLLDRRPLTDADDLWFQELRGGAWRILDRRRPVDDVEALVGFAESISGAIVVTLLDQPGRTQSCSDLDEAARLIVASFRS